MRICSNVAGEQLRFLKKCLEHAGYEAALHTPIDEASYRRLSSGGRLGRLWLRVRMYLTYPLGLIWRALRDPSEVLYIVTSNGFHAPWLAAEARALKDAPVVHLLYDLFPDALEVAGSWERDSMASRLVGGVQQRTQRICAGTVYLGEFLRAHAEARWGEAALSMVADVSAETDATPPELKPPDDTLVFRYGGQLGWMHEAELLANCIRAVVENPPKERAVRFELNVSGARAAWIQDALKGLPGVEVTGTLPIEAWRAHAPNCHVGLVTLQPGGATVCHPSKSYGMLAHGLALLVLCPQWSDLARLVHRTQTGVVVSTTPEGVVPEPGGTDYFQLVEQRRAEAKVIEEFKAAVHGLAAKPELLAQARLNAQRAMRDQFNADSLGARWSGFLEAVVASRAAEN
ncbi:MAG: hypothetical protein ACFBZ8_07470 [Opitutales bacterium]